MSRSAKRSSSIGPCPLSEETGAGTSFKALLLDLDDDLEDLADDGGGRDPFAPPEGYPLDDAKDVGGAIGFATIPAGIGGKGGGIGGRPTDPGAGRSRS